MGLGLGRRDWSPRSGCVLIIAIRERRNDSRATGFTGNRVVFDHDPDQPGHRAVLAPPYLVSGIDAASILILA